MSFLPIPFDEMFGTQKAERPFKPFPSLQPFCPKAFIYASKDPVLEDRGFVSDLRMSFGNHAHNLIQQKIANRYHCFGDWIDQAGRTFQHQTKPQPCPMEYAETHFNIPGVGRKTKPDLLVNFDLPEGFSLLEIKCVGECPADRPDRKHFLQANLTAYCCGMEMKVPDFFILYIERSHPERSKWTRYPVDVELAQLQLELMTGKIPIGICSCPGDWWCPFMEKCFTDGQSRLWSENPEISSRLEKLKWAPEETIL